MRASATALVFILGLTWASSAAQLPVETSPFALAPCAQEEPTLDGKLVEPAWRQAPRLGPFVTISGGRAKNHTEARILRVGDTLFIAVTCGLPPGVKPTVEQTARDSDVYMDESIEVFIDPKLNFHSYYHLLVNAGNIQRDERGDTLSTPMYDVAWNGKWRSATSSDDAAWYAELAVPLSELGLPGGKPALIGLNVCRNDHAAPDTTCWSPTGSGFHEPARFGLISLPAVNPAIQVDVKAALKGNLRVLGKSVREITFKNLGDESAHVWGTIIAGSENGRMETPLALAKLDAGQARSWTTEQETEHPGWNVVIVAALDGEGAAVAAARLCFVVPGGLQREYGSLLAGGEELGLWWAPSTYKIHRDKRAPTTSTPGISLSAAGNEFEAVQLVVRPKNDVEVSLEVSDFQGPGGTISADSFKLFEVAYVPVNIPSDKFGWVDDWPDPLPPLEGPMPCKAGVNQPFWLLAHIPAETPPGTYIGEVEVAADDKTVTVPIRLQVWGFSLTPETHTRTAYGVGPNFGFQGVTDREQQAQVYDLFMQSFRDHRIAPYSPFRFYPTDIKTLAPMRKYTCGRLTIEIEQGQQYPWKLSWDGEQIANQRVSQTHFARKGVGYKETGQGWPYINAIESVTEISSGPNMKVLEVVGLKTGSAVAARSFKLTFRLYIPAGDNWFGWRLMKMESTDENEITVRCYFNLPRTTFKAEAVANGKDFAAWSGEGVGFGMLCLGASVGSLRIGEGGEGVTVSNGVTPFKLKQPQTHEGWGPLVIYFVTDKTSSEALAARAEELRAAIDVEDPAGYVPSERAEIAVEAREDYTFTHDFTKFDEGARRYLEEFHFNGFRMTCMPGHIAGHKRFTDEYKRLQKKMYGPVIEHLREKGWLQYPYSYWFDEPSEKDYAYVIEGMKLLGENCPGLTRLLTEQPEEPLYDVIDLWVPVLSRYKPADCHARQEAGDLVWWYVCCGPRAPYPNNFVDHPAINHRIRFWMAEQYGVTGSLYWSTTFYGHTPAPEKKFRNPWKDGMTYRPSGGYWGNGDGMLLYPPCREKSAEPLIKGPVVSIRWEMLRDGIEDREYFWTLKQEVARLEGMNAGASVAKQKKIDAALRRAQQALASPGRLAQSLTKYTKDPQDLLGERERLAKAIEACRRIP